VNKAGLAVGGLCARRSAVNKSPSLERPILASLPVRQFGHDYNARLDIEAERSLVLKAYVDYAFINITVRVGKRLRSLREQAGLSQGEMAHQFGIDRGNISEWENAKVCPSLPMLETLADGFKITISKLLQGV
jgi:DNA-binding XRE family transcriptional regulator